MIECHTCELVQRRDAGEAPLWDSIYRTPHWDVVHCYDVALRGWMVIVARRHLSAIDEMSDAEAIELGMLIRRVSIALKELTGCAKTYVLQFAEHPNHPHVHFHIVPRMADQPEDRRGPNVMKYLNNPELDSIGETEMDALAVEVRRRLVALEQSPMLVQE